MPTDLVDVLTQLADDDGDGLPLAELAAELGASEDDVASLLSTAKAKGLAGFFGPAIVSPGSPIRTDDVGRWVILNDGRRAIGRPALDPLGTEVIE